METLLGRGGASVVYRAYDPRLKRKVALKILAVELSEDVRFRERFIRESELAASLDHPNIVPIYEAGEAEGLLYIAMRYVEGADLKALLRAEHVLEPERALNLVGQVAEALDAAHARGLVHRDVKPGNVLIAAQRGHEHCYLADFGLTKHGSSRSSLTAPGQLVGTLDYVAPEQIQGARLDGRADLYSLACLLYECLSGQVPFKRDSEVAVLYAHLAEPPPPVDERRRNLPRSLDTVFAKALAKSPRRRYTSCGELVAAARAACASGGARQVVATLRLGVRRHRLRLLAALLAAAAGTSAIAVSVGSGQRLRVPLPVDSLALLDSNTGRLAAALPTGARPTRVAVGAGSVWVANFTDRTLSSIDPKTHKQLATIGIGVTPSALAVSDGAVWVASEFAGTVLRIDPTTNAIVQTIPVGGGPTALAITPGAVWIAKRVDGTVVRIDSRTNEIVTTIPVGQGPTALAYGAGALWVANGLSNTVTRINPDTNSVIGKPIALRTAPEGIAATARAVWVSNTLAGSVSRIDPHTNTATATIPVGTGPTGIAVGEDAVWVANSLAGTLSRIDPHTNAVVETIRVGDNPDGLALERSSLWVAVRGLGRSAATEQAPTAIPKGGTLHVLGTPTLTQDLDAWAADAVGAASQIELFRCCLVRTLLSYNGQTTDEGGTELRPDLAVMLPQISSDRLTWTFHLKQGIHYAPPLQHLTIKAQDFIRALERLENPFEYEQILRAIDGWDAFRKGQASSISGIEAPTDTTLVFHLTEPSGELAYALSLPFAAPLPAGTAATLSAYGLVASGPYMIGGAGMINPSSPLSPRLWGRAGTRLILVRNPAWSTARDDLRAAAPDRIEISTYGDPKAVDSGRFDLSLDSNPPAAQVRRYARSSKLRSKLFTNPANEMYGLIMNLALPPFDDIHARRAAALALDKDRLRREATQSSVYGLPFENAGHLIPNSLEDNLLLTYDRDSTSRQRGDIRAARAEMATSRYDRNHDGRCDIPACDHVVIGISTTVQKGTKTLARNLRAIGITPIFEPGWRNFNSSRPATGMPATNAVFNGLYAVNPDGSEILTSVGGEPLLAATSRQLKKFGYPRELVGAIRAKFDQCRLQIGEARAICWAEADQLLMEKVLPVAPVAFADMVRVVSPRIAHYSFDQATAEPALDWIALKRPFR